MVAWVAEVGVGLARLALSPHAEPQATAVTALLERNIRSGLPHGLRAHETDSGPPASEEGLINGSEFPLLLFLLPRTCSPGTEVPSVPRSASASAL